MTRAACDRRCALALAVLVSLAAPLAAAVAPPAAAPAAPAAAPVADRLDDAMKRAATFLVACQDERDGSISQARGSNQNQTAMTSLALMALASIGHQPTDPTPEGKAMAKALAFILRDDRQGKGGRDQWEPAGYFGRSDNSRMYGHGITTLMLAELLGMGADARQDELIRDRCRKGVELILRSQQVRKRDPRHQGGWRYAPGDQDSDLSVTVWQVMALRAAKNAGLDVPKDAIDQAVEYIKRSYGTGRRDAAGDPAEKAAGFGYQPGQPARLSTAAEGLLALQVCGEYDAPEVKGAAEWLLAQRSLQSAYFYYGTYYYAQGMYQRGEPYAGAARRLVEQTLLPRQAPDGSWPGGEGTQDKTYSTSMAMLSLSVRYHFLPIYQR